MPRRVGQSQSSRSSRTSRRPTHGVSGFVTTGITGDFGFQYHNHGQTGQTDVAASRYSLQSHGSFQNARPGLFNPYFTQPGDFSPSDPTPNLSADYMEPLISSEEQGAYNVASKILSHQYQRLGKASHGTLLKNSIYEGFGQFDPAMQFMIRDDNISEDIPVIQTPSTLRHRQISLAPPIRQGEMQFSTSNPAQNITVSLVTPQNDNTQLAQKNTPVIKNESNVATGTHLSSGDASSSGINNVDTLGSKVPVTFAGSIQAPTATPYASLYPPPQADIRPTGSTGILRDVTPGDRPVIPLSRKPVQTQL